MSAPRYLLCAGQVRSRTDGQWHHVSASALAGLYGIPFASCYILPSGSHPGAWESRKQWLAREDLVQLWPRTDGNYALPPPKTEQ